MGDTDCERFNTEGDPRLVFLCDHAANAVPPELGTLGLAPGDLARHIAYDIGAADVTRALARVFGAPAILGRWSRLVADLNRGADDPTVVMQFSDGRIVPGNRRIAGAALAERLARYHAPYHAAVAATLAGARARGIVPVPVSIHSFTPSWRGRPRPWHVAVLWDRDARLARPLLDRLAMEKAWIVGDNEPYSGALEGDCLWRHGTMNGLPHALIEIRQDLVDTLPKAEAMAARLAAPLRDALAAMGPPALGFTRPLAFPDGGVPMDDKTRTELEAAAFRRLVAHLRTRTDVQNIDMMALAGFCRNCLGDWYREAAAEKGITLTKDEAREIVYGMAPAEWKRRYQKDASPEQLAAFAKAQKPHG